MKILTYRKAKITRKQLLAILCMIQGPWVVRPYYLNYTVAQTKNRSKGNTWKLTKLLPLSKKKVPYRDQYTCNTSPSVHRVISYHLITVPWLRRRTWDVPTDTADNLAGPDGGGAAGPAAGQLHLLHASSLSSEHRTKWRINKQWKIPRGNGKTLLHNKELFDSLDLWKAFDKQPNNMEILY